MKVIYDGIYAEDDDTQYKVYLMTLYNGSNSIETYYLKKDLLEKIAKEFALKQPSRHHSREYLYVDNIIKYSYLINVDKANTEVLKNALAREIVETILTANFDGTNFQLSDGIVTEKDIETLIEIYSEPKRIRQI